MSRTRVMDTRKILSVSAEMAAAIDDFRYGERIASEAEALRRLIAAGLAANERPASRKGGAKAQGRAAEPQG